MPRRSPRPSRRKRLAIEKVLTIRNVDRSDRTLIRSLFEDYQFWKDVAHELLVITAEEFVRENLIIEEEPEEVVAQGVVQPPLPPSLHHVPIEVELEDEENFWRSYDLEEFLRKIDAEQQGQQPRELSIGDLGIGDLSISDDSWLSMIGTDGLSINFSKQSWKSYPMNSEREAILSPYLDKLLETGIISKCPRKQLFSIAPINLVPKAGNKFRLIYDCRGQNQGTVFGHSIFNSPSKVEYFLKDKEWAGSLDISNAYWHFKLNERSSRNFGFKFRNEFFKWNVMPFGWNGAPAVFNKGMVRSWIRSRYKQFSRFYFDDWLTAGRSQYQAFNVFNSTAKDLSNDGWKIKWTKSLVPQKQITFIGFLFDLEAKKIYPAERNLVACAKLTGLEPPEVIFGLWNFCAWAKNSGMAQLVPLRYYWNSFNDEKKKEISRKVVKWLATGRKFKNFKEQEHTVIVYTDATTNHWGLWSETVKGAGKLPEEQIATAELQAVLKAIILFENVKMILRVDNSNVFHWLKKGYTSSSASKDIVLRNQTLAKIDRWCQWRNIKLQVELVPSAENLADSNSRSGRTFLEFS